MPGTFPASLERPKLDDDDDDGGGGCRHLTTIGATRLYGRALTHNLSFSIILLKNESCTGSA